MFSGDLDISPKWSVGASSGYDLKNNGITGNNVIGFLDNNSLNTIVIGISSDTYESHNKYR